MAKGGYPEISYSNFPLEDFEHSLLICFRLHSNITECKYQDSEVVASE